MSFEDANRRRKVDRLLAVIDEAGPATADDAASWSSAIGNVVDLAARRRAS